jgi:putative phosphoribosyl transferase
MSARGRGPQGTGMNVRLASAGACELAVPTEGPALPGLLAWPDHPSALVLFAHGSGSSRLSRRNAAVAGQLRAAGLATFLFDLLTPEEAERRAAVFEIGPMAERLHLAAEWLTARSEVAGLAVGYFGASTGAAAALCAAAIPGSRAGAVVSRGGRPDLAGDDLERVAVPTLLIVGSRDEAVLELNRRAYWRLNCTKRLLVVPGATHLFEEPGTLEEVGEAAAGWFVEHLVLAPRWHGDRR